MVARSAEDLARAYLEADQAAKAKDAIRPVLLEVMVAEGRPAVDVPGFGAVVFVPASSRTTIDAKAAAARIGELAGELRAHGLEGDEAVPLVITPIAASLKVARPPR